MAESLVSQNAVKVSVEKIYIKDLSLENPGSPQSFRLSEPPSMEIGLRSRADQVEPDVYEVILTITVTATAGERTVFLVEVAQAGIFQIRNLPEGELEPVMMIGCPNILFPYAREAVSDAVTRAGFQPVLLSPVNFESLYQAQRQQAIEQANGEVPIQ